jgi:monoamine oxidase
MELLQRGISFVILEASQRVGGRAYTDKTSLLEPWDQGCHWLHCADVNPLVAQADRVGSAYISEAREDWFGVWRNGRWGDEAERKKALSAVWNPLIGLADKDNVPDDISLSSYLDNSDEWGQLREHWVQLMASGDPAEVSARSYADYEDTETNWPVASGYGDLIERLAADLSVRTGVPVTAIEQSGRGVRVVTEDGTIGARAAIVTASTNVLASGAITFSDGPAKDLLELVEDVPCGAYEKAAFEFDGNPFVDMETVGGSIIPETGHILNFQLIRGVNSQIVGHVGGTPARELAALGEAAMIDFGHERLVQAFGADIAKRITGAAVTGWTNNPYVRGGYSFARPGSAHKRHAMITADSGNVAFAGEAFSLKWEATAHGAYQSGRDVAARIAGGLK